MHAEYNDVVVARRHLALDRTYGPQRRAVQENRLAAVLISQAGESVTVAGRELPHHVAMTHAEDADAHESRRPQHGPCTPAGRATPGCSHRTQYRRQLRTRGCRPLGAGLDPAR